MTWEVGICSSDCSVFMLVALDKNQLSLYRQDNEDVEIAVLIGSVGKVGWMVLR